MPNAYESAIARRVKPDKEKAKMPFVKADQAAIARRKKR